MELRSKAVNCASVVVFLLVSTTWANPTSTGTKVPRGGSVEFEVQPVDAGVLRRIAEQSGKDSADREWFLVARAIALAEQGDLQAAVSVTDEITSVAPKDTAIGLVSLAAIGDADSAAAIDLIARISDDNIRLFAYAAVANGVDPERSQRGFSPAAMLIVSVALQGANDNAPQMMRILESVRSRYVRALAFAAMTMLTDSEDAVIEQLTKLEVGDDPLLAALKKGALVAKASNGEISFPLSAIEALSAMREARNRDAVAGVLAIAVSQAEKPRLASILNQADDGIRNACRLITGWTNDDAVEGWTKSSTESLPRDMAFLLRAVKAAAKRPDAQADLATVKSLSAEVANPALRDFLGLSLLARDSKSSAKDMEGFSFSDDVSENYAQRLLAIREIGNGKQSELQQRVSAAERMLQSMKPSRAREMTALALAAALWPEAERFLPYVEHELAKEFVQLVVELNDPRKLRWDVRVDDPLVQDLREGYRLLLRRAKDYSASTLAYKRGDAEVHDPLVRAISKAWNTEWAFAIDAAMQHESADMRDAALVGIAQIMSGKPVSEGVPNVVQQIRDPMKKLTAMRLLGGNQGAGSSALARQLQTTAQLALAKQLEIHSAQRRPCEDAWGFYVGFCGAEAATSLPRANRNNLPSIQGTLGAEYVTEYDRVSGGRRYSARPIRSSRLRGSLEFDEGSRLGWQFHSASPEDAYRAVEPSSFFLSGKAGTLVMGRWPSPFKYLLNVRELEGTSLHIGADELVDHTESSGAWFVNRYDSRNKGLSFLGLFPDRASEHSHDWILSFNQGLVANVELGKLHSRGAGGDSAPLTVLSTRLGFGPFDGVQVSHAIAARDRVREDGSPTGNENEGPEWTERAFDRRRVSVSHGSLTVVVDSGFVARPDSRSRTEFVVLSVEYRATKRTRLFAGASEVAVIGEGRKETARRLVSRGMLHNW